MGKARNSIQRRTRFNGRSDLGTRNGVGSVYYRGRIITQDVIADMRAESPEHTGQLDESWKRLVLKNNAPWIANPDLLKKTESTWGELKAMFPEAFQDCGCDDC